MGGTRPHHQMGQVLTRAADEVHSHPVSSLTYCSGSIVSLCCAVLCCASRLQRRQQWVNRRIPSCRTAKQASKQAKSKPREVGGRVPGLRVCAALHCQELSLVILVKGRKHRIITYSGSPVDCWSSEINQTNRPRTRWGKGKEKAQHLFPSLIIKIKQHCYLFKTNLIVVSTGGMKKKEGTSAEFPILQGTYTVRRHRY